MKKKTTIDDLAGMIKIGFDSVDEKLKRASRNLQDLFSIKLARDVNAYHILRRKKLLIEKQAIATLEGRALKGVAAVEKVKKS